MNAADLDGSYFLDTNVLVYSFDENEPDKKAISLEFIRTGMLTGEGVISTQVMQEFLHLALSRFKKPLTIPEAQGYFAATLLPLCRVHTTPTLMEAALSVRAETGYAFYDSLIVAAAIQAKCRWLVSEDLQHGRKVRGVKIINPYK